MAVNGGARSIRAYDLVTGRQITSLPASTWSWTRSLSDAGTMSVTVADVGGVDRAQIFDSIKPWRAVLADVEFMDRGKDYREEVVHMAGIVTARAFTSKSATFTCTGFAGIFSKLLCINPAFLNVDPTGQIISPDVEPGEVQLPSEWVTHMSGSMPYIHKQLIEMALQWQSLPVQLPDVYEPGDHVRTYYSSDLTSIYDRIRSLTDTKDGAEWFWKPQITSDGTLMHELLLGNPELDTGTWPMNSTTQMTPVTSMEVSEDGADIATDAWAMGGKQDDKVLVARSVSTRLTDQGWPRLMRANTGHQSVSRADTLRGYTDQDVRRDGTAKVFRFDLDQSVGAYYLYPGDSINIKWAAWFSPTPVQSMLKVMSVEGGPDPIWTVHCREKITESQR